MGKIIFAAALAIGLGWGGAAAEAKHKHHRHHHGQCHRGWGDQDAIFCTPMPGVSCN